jgi:transposase
VPNEEWYNLGQASQKLGRSRSYVSLWLRRHKGEVPENMIMEGGKSKLISAQGIEWIRDHIKKEGVLVSNSSANGDQHLKLRLLGATLLIIHFTGRDRGTSREQLSRLI